MNDFCVSPDGKVCVYRYFSITKPRYERPTDDEFEVLAAYGYEYKGASECFYDSIYLFEYKCDESWHKVQARSIEEAMEKARA